MIALFWDLMCDAGFYPRRQPKRLFTQINIHATRVVIAELRRPEGSTSGAPYSKRKEKETHAALKYSDVYLSSQNIFDLSVGKIDSDRVGKMT